MQRVDARRQADLWGPWKWWWKVRAPWLAHRRAWKVQVVAAKPSARARTGAGDAPRHRLRVV
jgi:hypothetical protein